MNDRLGDHQTPDWRDLAMNEALRGFDYGENLDALLSAIRRNNPCAGTLIVNPDRISLLRFLQEKTQGFRPLVRSTDDYRDEGIYPYTGWYEVFWEGARIEIAFTPNYRNRETVCIGDDSGTLVRFAAALTEYTLRPRGRCLRYADGWENAAELDAEIEKVTWDDIVLAPGLMTGVRAAVESFFHQRDAFAAMGFAWRRGILLIGPPGTGKTMVCKAAAAALPELPFLYVRDLREEDHQEAIKAIFKRARRLAPCLLAFEDMDGLVTSENRTVFLNEMDGFQSNDGLLVIASSNHPGKIDEAMLKRPSRFDRVFHVGLPGPEERQRYCEQVLSRSSLTRRIAPELDVIELARQIAERTDGFTPAYLKEALVSAALHQAQEGATLLDTRFATSVLTQVDELRQHLRHMRDPDALAEMHSSENTIGLRR